MLNKDKKYTMVEFKEMFDKAQVKALEELDNKMNEVKEENKREKDGMFSFMFSMQNLLAMSELRKQLFKEDK